MHMLQRLVGLISAVILAATFYSWRFAYFWLDDFNNLYWVRGESFTQMVWHNVNPASQFFRPFAMFFYWILWRAFDLNPLPYHLAAWAIHAANVVFLYVLLSRISGSRYGAAVGALLFGFRANFADIYWSFGTIFELTACLLMLLTLLLYTGKQRNSYRTVILVCVLYVLAIKSKEMAITIPAVLLLHDLCLGERFDRKRVVAYSLLAAIGLWFVYFKASEIGASPQHPYYMDLRVLTFGRGYGWYFDRLYGMRLRWGAWMIASVVLLAAFILRREKRGLFFLGYAFVTLLPVVFLVNHRYEFYWYIPFFGIAGLAAVLVDAIERRLRARIPVRLIPAAGLAVFITIAAAHYSRESAESAAHLEQQRSISSDYTAFIGGLRKLPEPPRDEKIYYKSMPQHFAPDVLMTATQVALHRTDVQVEVVKDFPDSCRYCLRFENATLILNQQLR